MADDLPQPPDADQRAAALAVLEALARHGQGLAALPDDERERWLRACGSIARPDPATRRAYNKARRKRRRAERRDGDEAVLARTGIRTQRAALVFPTPAHELPESTTQSTTEPATQPTAAGALREARTCYTCKRDYREVHHFYDALCSECAELNWRKRQQSADLRGRVAVLTGGRVKIGYQTGIKLLRAGCRLFVTTRFPRDAAQRYAAEADFEQWRDRLELYGLDLRHTPSVEAFARHLSERTERLDFLINNACQTVRRPPAFYAHLMPGEEQPLQALPDDQRPLVAAYEQLREAGTLAPIRPGGAPLSGLREAAALSQLPMVDGDHAPDLSLFPSGQLDADLQQLDLRDRNSWRLPLAEVPTVELLEVHLVNAVAPFVLNARLKPLMLRTPDRDKHVVNVSAMEGQFYRSFKTDKHPHTNMAKASLNMLTRTSAADYHRDGIHMNSVDTGWITDEDPAHIAARKQQEHGFHPPLDHVDAAARILDPIFDGLLRGEHVWGQFLKDYAPTRW